MILIVTYKYDYTYYFFRAIQSDSLLLLLLSVEFNLKRNFMLISFLVTPRYSLHRKSRSHAWFFSFIYPFPKQFTGSLIPFKCNRWIFSKVLQTTGFKHIWYASIYCSYYSFWCSGWFLSCLRGWVLFTLYLLHPQPSWTFCFSLLQMTRLVLPGMIERWVMSSHTNTRD